MRNGQILSLIILLSSGVAWGQASAGFGAVGGIIHDSNGEGIPDVTVVLSNDALGTERALDTTDDGVFYAPTVIPAPGYKLNVTRKDFTGWESAEFVVSTGRKLTFDVTLLPTENGVKAEAIGGLRAVEELKNGLGVAIPPEDVETTPSSGRRLDPLVGLAPAVTSANALPGVWVFHGVPFSNLFLTDGLLTTNTYFLEKPGVANQLSVDAVQDFHVASADFSAEFGGTMGGIVNASTRSGTTSYHGELYDYFRDRSLQARDRYAMGYDTRQRQHQGGISVGGPLHGEKLFFFVNLEALSRNAQGLNRITNPLLANASGTRILSSDCQATAAQCAVATRFLQSQMNVLEPLWEHSARGLLKIDYRRSDRNSFSFDGNAMEWHAPALAETEVAAPNGGLIGDPVVREKTRFAKAGWTATGSSQKTNDLRIGWFQDRIAEYPTPTGLSTGPLGISIAGTVVGATQPFTAVLPSEHRFQLVDNGNWTVGSHALKAGLEMLKTTDYLNSISNPAGWYSYPSLTAFALDFGQSGLRNYNSFTQGFGTPNRTLDTRVWSFYAEDTWRASARLTIDYALRYERPRLPQPTMTNTDYFQTASVTAPWLNLAPRVGIAYLLNERTVVRAGFGFYYAPFSGQLLDALFLGNALYQTGISVTPSQAGAPVFPKVFTSASAVPNGTKNVTFSQGKFPDPYQQEISLAVERRLTSDTTITLSLLRSRGMKLWTTQDANLAGPTQTETYTIHDASGQPAGSYTTQYWTGKVNANYAHVFQIENGGSSWYNAAALQLHRRMAHGLSVDATYTFSHAIDTTGQNAPFGTAASPSAGTNYNGDKGNSAFDQRHRATIQWLWQPSISKGNSAAARYLWNGWQLSTLTTLASSQFATPVVSVEGQQFSGVTMAYPSTLNGSGGWARVPFLPINSLKTGPQYSVDARLAHTLPITERVKVMLLVEAFNVFNTQYDTGVNTIAYLASPVSTTGVVNGPRAGVLTPVPGVGNGNASQSFPDGTNARRAQVALRILF